MAHTHENEHHVEHHHGYGYFTMIWITLVALTGLTVAVAGVDMGLYTVAVALLIACIKAMLVINYFMHIKFDSLLLKVLVGMCGLIMGVIILWLGFDVIFG